MLGFRLLRSPPLLLLLPQLGIGIAASSSHAGTMNLGSNSSGGAPCSPSAERRRQQCVQLSTVPGADPQRSPSAFSKTNLNIWKFTVHVLLKAGLENFKHYLLVCEMSAILR